MKVAEVGDGRVEEEVELAQATGVGDPIVRCDAGHGVHEAATGLPAQMPAVIARQGPQWIAASGAAAQAG